MTTSPISAPLVAILAGGEGRRMGGGKPFRPFLDDTLIARALRLARGYGAEVIVTVRDPDGFADVLGAHLVVDSPAIPGPMAGLHSSLCFAADRGIDRVLTLPCDAPFLPADLFARLDDQLGPDVLCAMSSSGGHLHPVCALWRAASLGMLIEQANRQDYSLRRLAERAGVRSVAWDVADIDPFSSANTPEELEALSRRAAAGSTGAD